MTLDESRYDYDKRAFVILIDGYFWRNIRTRVHAIKSAK